MNIVVNGNSRELAREMSVTELLQHISQAPSAPPHISQAPSAPPHLALDPRFIAVAVNGACVPRSQYDRARIADGDRVEILVPQQGG